MIKVLLADDEPIITQGLRILIDWNKCGYEVAAEAANGLEALHILTHQHIDLAIIDLKMPGLSGLEVMEKVREYKDIDTRFVILTGFSDFSFAQQALRLHAEDYLLKPVQKAELELLLTKLRCRIIPGIQESDNSSGKDIAEQAAEYTRANYWENLSLTVMGETFHINNVYLGQLFKDRYGISYKEYLNQIRIEKAALLLEQTALKVYDISQKVGYKNTDYFINKFTRIKGITPHQYRIRNKGDNNL